MALTEAEDAALPAGAEGAGRESGVTAKATVMATMPAAPKSGVPSVNGLRVWRELCLWATEGSRNGQGEGGGQGGDEGSGG